MIFRKATRNDIPFIVKMIANDKLGQHREKFTDPLPEAYYDAFAEIDADPNQELIVAENDSKEIIGTLQLTFMRSISFQGGLRAQIEAVRIREDQRGAGIGEKMIRWAIERAQQREAFMVQLTSNKQRPDAIRFYERLGFKASHEGMKLDIELK
jgi:ribosomal protein S18 acetylase RimI-like enzyme